MKPLHYSVEIFPDDAFAHIMFSRIVSHSHPVAVFDVGDLSTMTEQLPRRIFSIPSVFKVTILENIIGIERYSYKENSSLPWTVVALRVAMFVSMSHEDRPLISMLSVGDFRKIYADLLTIV
jgi:hypothetical protein